MRTGHFVVQWTGHLVEDASDILDIIHRVGGEAAPFLAQVSSDEDDITLDRLSRHLLPAMKALLL